MWKYDALDATQLELLKHGIIDLGGDVDEDMVRYVREALIRLTAQGSPQVEVMITSGGGSVKVGLDIYDALRYYVGKKAGIVHGFAQSMAALILQACDHRRCLRHAFLLIHHVAEERVSLDVLRDDEKLRRLREDLEESQSRLYKILSTRTRKSVDEIGVACSQEKEMTAEQALAFGLIDEIVD